jgi:hypothetical protein
VEGPGTPYTWLVAPPRVCRCRWEEPPLELERAPPKLPSPESPPPRSAPAPSSLLTSPRCRHAWSIARRGASSSTARQALLCCPPPPGLASADSTRRWPRAAGRGRATSSASGGLGDPTKCRLGRKWNEAARTPARTGQRQQMAIDSVPGARDY